MSTKTLRRARGTAIRHTPRRQRTAKYPEPDVAGVARPVLIATDGSKVAGSAIRLARIMADGGEWAPEVVTVFEPLPISVADVTLIAPTPAYAQVVTDSVLGLIRSQIRRAGGADWHLSVEFGRAAPGIARAAQERAAELVIMGLGEHGKLARMFGAETVARVMRHVNVPVLAVAFAERERPFTAVVAMDFGESSVRAAREAYALLQAPGRLHLVHVRPRITAIAPFADAEWDTMYDAGVAHGFERVKQELGHRAGIEVTSEVRRGDVVESLLKAVTRQRADLIAAGSHSQTVIDRLMIGSTPAHLLRAAKCSVLVAPPSQRVTGD
jgi:nucleotide-binding universal stress UspA family protein